NSCDEPTIDLPTPEQEKKRKEILARVAELDRLRKVLDTTSPTSFVKWEQNLRLSDKDHLAPEIQRILDLAPNSRDGKQAETLREVYRTSDMARHIAGALDTSTPFGRVAQLQAFQFRHSVDKRIVDLKKN